MKNEWKRESSRDCSVSHGHRKVINAEYHNDPDIPCEWIKLCE